MPRAWILLFAQVVSALNALDYNELATNHVGEITRQEQQARLLSLTNGGTVTGELLMTLPLTLLLPSIAMDRDPDGHLTHRHVTDRHVTGHVTGQVTDGHMDELWRLLRIPSNECRRKVLCEMVREPEKFEPISGVFYLTMRHNGSDGWVPDHYSECEFPECPLQTNEMLDFRMMGLLQQLSRKLAIKITDHRR